MPRVVHRTLASALFVTLLAGLALVGPAAGASPDPSAPSRGSDGDPTARGTHALDRVARVLRPVVPDAAGPRRHADVTLALRDLFLARPALEGTAQEQAGELLARPTDGRRDPYGDGYRVPSTKLCGKHVCVHWVGSTSDAPPDRAWVRTTLRVMERTWRHHVSAFGYRRPPTDHDRGGDNRFDVYLSELGDLGLYGYCAPEERAPGAGRRATSYCVLDNDFARSQFHRKPVDTLRVTAAHEFFHAVQFAYDYREDPWLLESTATWMEEQAAGNVNDNRSYLPYGQLDRPGRSLDLFDATGYGQYGNWLFWQYLSQRFGPSVVRAVIRHSGTGGGLPNQHSTDALRTVLRRHGGLGLLYRAFASANAIPAITYPEGRHYPAPIPALDRRLGRNAAPVVVRTRINHLAARHLRVEPRRSLGRHWSLRLRIDGPANRVRPGAVLTVLKTNGTAVRRDVRLDRHGNARTGVPFSHQRIASVTLTLVNASSRFRCGEETGYTCRGTPLDDRADFGVTLRVVRH